MLADEDVARFIGGPQHRAGAWRSMATMAGSWFLRGFGMFSAIEKESGRWVGRIGPCYPEEWPGTEIGWALIRSAWGKGYATEAAAATMDWVFQHLGWTDVIHCITPENRGSIAVARRLGSRDRGPGRLPPPYEHVPLLIWGQTREEWMARKRG